MSNSRKYSETRELQDSRLKVHPNNYSANCPYIEQPSVQGYFGLDSQRTYCSNLNQLKYIHIPNNPKHVDFDLDHRVTDAIHKEDVDEKLDNMLKWILQHKNAVKMYSSSGAPDVICYRGLLTVIMCTPYERQEGWIINATKWKGTVYLCATETEEKRRQRNRATPQQKRYSSWGFKFEQYMTSGSPRAKPNTESAVNENEELCVIFKTKLNSHRLLYGAEIDGVADQVEINNLKELQKAEFIELKTNRVIEYDKQHHNFIRYKLIKWWCQTFLVGITRLMCGFRNEQGMVLDVQEFRVSDLRKMAKGVWEPGVCMNFCDHFLSLVKQVVKEEQPQTVWKFQWQPDRDVTFTRVEGPSQFSFLPQWFTDNMR